MPAERCYMCNKPAVSKEHVPPRSLFPEARDANGIDYRKNLITVPSCDKHNSEKSHDDEFLMVSLAGIVGNNKTGCLHKLTKVQRAITRTNGILLDRIFTKKEEKQIVEYEPNRFYEILWGKPDAERLLRCFDRIGRALHYSHFGRRFKGRVVTSLIYLRHDDVTQKNWTAFLSHRAALDLRGKPRVGNNPNVFYFQVTDVDQFGLYLFRLRFYGGIEVLISFVPKGVILPGNLPLELMNRGMPVVFKLEDKNYVMNPTLETAGLLQNVIAGQLPR